MRKTNVEKWFMLDESNKLEDQVKAYIASTVEGYLNGVQWDANMYTPMTKEDWKEYITKNLDRDIEMGMIVNGTEFRHFRFIGNKRFEELMNIFLDNYEDVQEMIQR